MCQANRHSVVGLVARYGTNVQKPMLQDLQACCSIVSNSSSSQIPNTKICSILKASLRYDPAISWQLAHSPKHKCLSLTMHLRSTSFIDKLLVISTKTSDFADKSWPPTGSTGDTVRCPGSSLREMWTKLIDAQQQPGSVANWSLMDDEDEDKNYRVQLRGCVTGWKWDYNST